MLRAKQTNLQGQAPLFLSNGFVSGASLVVANLLPLYGLIFERWQLYSILFLYWFESAVIGFINVLKMRRASQPERFPVEYQIGGKTVRDWSRPAVMGFFTLHYGIFMAIHLLVINGLFKMPSFPLEQLWPAILMLMANHGLSYFLHFIRDKEYLEVSPGQQMFRPYSRIVTMHVTVLVGAILTKVTGSNLAILIVLVVTKIIVDLYLHVQEHSPRHA